MTGLSEREFNPLKVLHHIDRLRALADGEDVAPVTVEIDPVAYCNHACGWCVDPVHEPVQMTPEMYECLISELSGFDVNGFRVEGVVFKGGGEPTLHPQFGAMLERAAAAGFAIGVVTNGSRLMDWADVLAAHAAYLRVSIDGPTAESHERVHRSNDFAAILAGTQQLVENRRRTRSPVVGLSFAMDIQTVELGEEAIRLGERLGVDYILLRPPFFEEVGRVPTMTVAEARHVRSRLQEVAARYEGPIEVQIGNWVGDAESSGRRDARVARSLPIEHRTGRCLASPLLAVITAAGVVYGCCNLRALGGWSFGRLNYAAGQNLAALWRGEQRREILERMHRTECIAHCTHPLSRYNEMIEVLKDRERPHSQFV